jgi:hypothetical protein
MTDWAKDARLDDQAARNATCCRCDELIDQVLEDSFAQRRSRARRLS